MNSTSKSLISFTNRMIDYAGLFPPAKLDLANALKNFVKYQNEEYSGMLSNFICPAGLIPELHSFIKNNDCGNFKFQISAIIKSGNTVNEFDQNLTNDLSFIKDIDSSAENVIVKSLEIKMPDDLIETNSSENISSFLDNASAKVTDGLSESLFVFAEGQPGENSGDSFKALINGIEIHNLKSPDFGFKLRTGGTDAESFPSSDQIALCIRECLDRKVPMKFTAGLHHPIRHYDKTIGTNMHGFLNVFGAGIISMRHDISLDGMKEILDDENAEHFKFTDDYFEWNGWKVQIEDIVYARKNLVTSYGSCSFDEPIDDLKSLNLL